MVNSSDMKVHILRLKPGDDVRKALEAFVLAQDIEAAIVLSAVGSLSTAALRFCDRTQTTVLAGPFELVSLTGTLSNSGGSHLHMSISDKDGGTLGGHVTEGSIVYTTLEIGVGELPQLKFSREVDPVTTYKELNIISKLIR